MNDQSPQDPESSMQGFGAPKDNLGKMMALHGFQATVVDFFADGQPEEKSLSVYKLLYEDQQDTEDQQKAAADRRKRDFRWYHLPVNNVEWVERLIEKHLHSTHRNSCRLSDEFKSAAGLTGSHDRHHSTSASPFAFMRPMSFSFDIDTWGQKTDYDQIGTFAPYLHFETLSNFEASSASINNVLRILSMQPEPKPHEKPKTSREQKHHSPEWILLRPKHIHDFLHREYLTPVSPGEAGALQIRRTLDQYYYTHLDTSHRDKDQVVYRYSRDILGSTKPKLFMVDQLWLWVINKDSVISCAPESIDDILMGWESPPSLQNEPRDLLMSGAQGPSTQPVQETAARSVSRRTRRPKSQTQGWVPLSQLVAGDDSPKASLDKNHRRLDVRHNIIQYLKRTTAAQIKSPYELASLIMNKCANVFADHDIPADYQFFDFFERSIGKVSDSVAQLLRSFQHTVAEGFDEVEEQLNIDQETKLLVEIEDIHDELIILRMVLNDQQAVAKKLSGLLDPLGYDQNQQSKTHTRLLSAKENPVLERHLQRIDMMEKMTEKTAKTLRSLLDFKQKQASISGALSLVKYAERNAQQTHEAASQGRTLTLFTVVTIVFLPLSFLAAFFAIDIDIFPVDDNGKLSLDYVLKFLLGISAGLSVPFIWVAFNLERVVQFIHVLGRLDVLSSFPVGILFSVSILVPIWTSSLDSTIKSGVTIATLLFVLFGILSTWLYRWVFVSRESTGRFIELHHSSST